MVLSVGNESKKTKGKDERMDVTAHHRKMVLWVLALAAGLVLAAAGTAWAQPPITVSHHVHKDTGSFTDWLSCQGDQLYNYTMTSHELVHVTAAGVDEDGNYLLPLHFHHTFVGKFVAVPVDGTGPTYIGHSRDVETLNAKSFEEFLGTYTDDHRVIAMGSDGSKINFHLHVRYSVNAKGEVTVDFVRVRPDASCISPDE